MANEFLWPVNGWVLATTQYLNGVSHNLGTADITAPYWTPVYASRGGRVSFVSNQQFSGAWVVYIDHEPPWQTIYGHFIEQPLVAVGDVVKVGQPLGYVGRTGEATNPHCHFGILKSGAAVPAAGIDFGQWIIAGLGVPGDFGVGLPLPQIIPTEDIIVSGDQPFYDITTLAELPAVPSGTRLTSFVGESGFHLVLWNGKLGWIPRSAVKPAKAPSLTVPPFSVAIATKGVNVYGPQSTVVATLSVTDSAQTPQVYALYNVSAEYHGYYQISAGWIPGWLTTGPR